MLDKEKIMILCKVVDNFGDIGVVYRLARSLSDARGGLELTLAVSNLESFQALCPKIDPGKAVQGFQYKDSRWKVVFWDEKLREDEIPSIILECFQCGRPDWLVETLFAPDFTRTVQILNIDYLTGEDYADEFHLLKSGTRKANIKKIFFMPGFTDKTGGLIFNETPLPAKKSSGSYDIFFFAYEDDPEAVVKGIKDFQKNMREQQEDFSVTVHVAAGKSSSPFLKCWQDSGSPFLIKKLPFMPQEEFDSFIQGMDFLFVRGEDSLARAALTGLPFVWQAYKQDENYQLVKVNALLERMADSFQKEDFEPIRSFWQNYNDYERKTESDDLTKMLTLCVQGKGVAGFADFAAKIRKNGNLAEHLLDFIDSLDF